MALTAQDVYEESVSILPLAERLRLASLILDGLAPAATSPPALVHQSGNWTDEDRADLTAFSLAYATALYSEDEDLVE